MARTYNDIIKRRAGRAAYSIEEEKGKDWTSFIPNEQFNKVLDTVLRAVRGNDIDAHKSFWIDGTYGTGKSHAAAVITHLLCDPVDDIREWVDYEYHDSKFAALREAVYAVRREKRLLPVKIEGLKAMSSPADLPLVLQSAVTRALGTSHPGIVVDTDYETLARNVEDNRAMWNDLVARDGGLRAVAPDLKLLCGKLRNKDMGVFQRAKAALHAANIHVFLNQNDIAEWLAEIQEELRRTSPCTGLLILWDEFTDVMSDSIGLQVLKALQTVAQKFANPENDSFLFLISHPSAFDKLDPETVKQTDGRYHRMKYNMETVSAFKIMSRKFEITDPELHGRLSREFYAGNRRLIDDLVQPSNDPEETRKDLMQLFPLHPGTANLATYYATVIGSSSRSVFEFIGQNPAMERFLASEEAFRNRELVTADYLWDFVLDVFREDVANYSAVTERYSTYAQHVRSRGEAASAVFKAALLLNAFNNISADNESHRFVIPTEENIAGLFAGTRYEDEAYEVLDWFNEQSIIQRDPTGVYSVQFSALPPQEIEGIKKELMEGKYRYASEVLKFDGTAEEHMNRLLQKVIHVWYYEFFSEAANDYVLREAIRREKKKSYECELFMAMFFALDHEEAARLRKFAEKVSMEGKEDKELADIAYVVFDTPFGEKEYERFIEYAANCVAAQKHGFVEQTKVHQNHAAGMVKEWMEKAGRGNVNIYVHGEEISVAARHLSSMLNDNVAPEIFPLAPDAIEIVRHRSPQTFWKTQVSKEIIRRVISATGKSELDELGAAMAPFKYVVQDALDENLHWRQGMDENHPLKAVHDFVNNRIRNANKSQTFNFAEKFGDLCRPPYGLSPNYASAGMVAFALRGYVNKIFDPLGKPLDANNLADSIAELFTVWDKGKSPAKLNFKFQTPEEGKLCKALVSLFRLDKLKEYADIASLKNARSVITGPFLEQKGYPLWTLKYVDEDFARTNPVLTLGEDLRRLFDDIVRICTDAELRNPALVQETLDLIGRYRFDVQNYFNKPGAFKNGFDNFLRRTAGEIGLKPEEVPEAYAFIRQNLQSTVGYWTEDEVRNTFNRWRAVESERQKKREEEEHRRREEEARRATEEERKAKETAQRELEVIKGEPQTAQRKKASAREYVDSLRDPADLRKALDAVIDLGYERVLDAILSTRQS